ncbi:MAG TPA: aminotransferase class I/II-fold pyridoxal phosphate-dependent enzyme, partial [Steroidobacteraceae bacterium]|nr:aminotransferase class I/II-fold pyridoxal phosphate-dependent enzyme [Steroidobacteraceae bacterium]
MHPGLDRLRSYPFERLARLLAGISPPATLKHIPLSVGEPKHSPPALAVEALIGALGALGTYPATAGLPEFRRSAAHWLDRRFALGGSLDPDTMILPVNGTREALFAFAQTIVDPAAHALVAMPNPCYQIYEGAALLAGAEPCFLDTTAANRFVPELAAVPDALWRRCALLYLCSPGNPSGA